MKQNKHTYSTQPHHKRGAYVVDVDDLSVFQGLVKFTAELRKTVSYNACAQSSMYVVAVHPA